MSVPKPSIPIDVYQERTDDTKVYPDARALEYLTWGLASEVGEFLAIFKRSIRDNDEADLIKIQAELGDMMWYIAQLCSYFGLSMSNVLNYNLDKLAKRKHTGTLHGAGDER